MDASSSPHCSWVLAADDPAALAVFYGALVQRCPESGPSGRHWCLQLPSGGRLEIYAPSRSRGQARQTGRLALCLRRGAPSASTAETLLQHWVAEVLAQGATLLEGPRQEPFGWEAWLADPEQNRLLLLVTA